MFNERLQKFSIRKLTVGAVSVLIGTTFFLTGNNSEAKADTLTPEQAVTETVKDNASDTANDANGADQVQAQENAQDTVNNKNKDDNQKNESPVENNEQGTENKVADGSNDPSKLTNTYAAGDQKQNPVDTEKVGIKADDKNPATKTITRTITPVEYSGFRSSGIDLKPITQPVVFSRIDKDGFIGYEDPATGKITYNEWESKDPTFAAVDLQTIGDSENIQYKPTITHIGSATVTPDSDNININVDYTTTASISIASYWCNAYNLTADEYKLIRNKYNEMMDQGLDPDNDPIPDIDPNIVNAYRNPQEARQVYTFYFTNEGESDLNNAHIIKAARQIDFYNSDINEQEANPFFPQDIENWSCDGAWWHSDNIDTYDNAKMIPLPDTPKGYQLVPETLLTDWSDGQMGPADENGNPINPIDIKIGKTWEQVWDNMIYRPLGDNTDGAAFVLAEQNATVKYIDDTTGKVIKTDDLNGASGRDSNYNTKDAIQNFENKGYTLVSDDTKGQNIIFDKDNYHDQDYTVHLTKPIDQSYQPAEQPTTGYTGDASTADAPVASNDQTNASTTPDKDDSNSSSSEETNEQVHSTSVDKATKHQTHSSKSVANHSLNRSGINSTTSKITSNSITDENSETLPQTGAKDTSTASVFGLITMAFGSLIALAADRKKKRN